MGLNVGDIISFPEHANSCVIEARGGSILLSQGAPGNWRIDAIEHDGTISISPVREEAACA